MTPTMPRFCRCAAIAAALALAPLSARAEPAGGTVVAGVATISQTQNKTTVTQSTGTAIVEWQSFNVAADETVVFQQPGADAVVLNRVIGAGPSVIDGSVTGTGQVWIVNGAGVLIGPGGYVSTGGGFLATTASVSDTEFLAGADYVEVTVQFEDAPAGSAVRNRGVISVAGDGTVMLFAPVVSNSGLIETTDGQIFLGSVTELEIDLDGEEYYIEDDPEYGSGVSNTGAIVSLGGESIELAGVANGLIDIDIVSTGGAVEAARVAVYDGEVILIEGDYNAGTPISVNGLGVGEVSVTSLGGTLVLESDTPERKMPRTDAGFGGCSPPSAVLSGSGDDDGCLNILWAEDPILGGDIPFSNRGNDAEWN